MIIVWFFIIGSIPIETHHVVELWWLHQLVVSGSILDRTLVVKTFCKGPKSCQVDIPQLYPPTTILQLAHVICGQQLSSEKRQVTFQEILGWLMKRSWVDGLSNNPGIWSRVVLFRKVTPKTRAPFFTTNLANIRKIISLKKQSCPKSLPRYFLNVASGFLNSQWIKDQITHLHRKSHYEDSY